MAILVGAVDRAGPTFTATFTSSIDNTVSTTGLVLIDTGATSSAVSKRIVKDLGLVVVGAGKIRTPGSDTAAVTLKYRVGVGIETLAGHSKQKNVTIEDAVVYGNLNLGDIECLLGRDILRDAILVYNGPTQSFTLSF